MAVDSAAVIQEVGDSVSLPHLRSRRGTLSCPGDGHCKGYDRDILPSVLEMDGGILHHITVRGFAETPIATTIFRRYMDGILRRVTKGGMLKCPNTNDITFEQRVTNTATNLADSERQSKPTRLQTGKQTNNPSASGPLLPAAELGSIVGANGSTTICKC